jgi:HK97 gp10 family phage protein
MGGVMDNFHIKFDPSGLYVALDQLQAGVKEQVRPAAQAGAQVLYEEVLLRVPVSKSVRKYKGKTYAPGGLKASIYQVFSQDNSADGRATYHVSWNYKKAPHGHLVEYGTSRAPAHPFLRPAYDAKAKAALEATKARFEEETQKVIAGLKT